MTKEKITIIDCLSTPIDRPYSTHRLFRGPASTRIVDAAARPRGDVVGGPSTPAASLLHSPNVALAHREEPNLKSPARRGGARRRKKQQQRRGRSRKKRPRARERERGSAETRRAGSLSKSTHEPPRPPPPVGMATKLDFFSRFFRSLVRLYTPRERGASSRASSPGGRGGGGGVGGYGGRAETEGKRSPGAAPPAGAGVTEGQVGRLLPAWARRRGGRERRVRRTATGEEPIIRIENSQWPCI